MTKGGATAVQTFARRAPLLLALFALVSCEKVPLVDVNAFFTLADATWFEGEQTMFVFYNVEAEQGLGPTSEIEVTYRTDAEQFPWTAVENIKPVHIHLPVSCGGKSRCGSMSMKVTLPPRDVGIRLRYHRDGELALNATVVLNQIAKGPAWSNRSLLVYGVFEETNTQIEWRSRNQFPTLRNEQAGDYGLRRIFRVANPAHGNVPAPPPENPYGYAFAAACPGVLTALNWPPTDTFTRGIFEDGALDVTADPSTTVCAMSTVTDALGTFDAPVIARKNPEVRVAFPELRNPVRENVEVGILLRPCARTISEPHRKMQVQRLLLDLDPEFCIDNWQAPSFVATLVQALRARIDTERAQGKDMVLAIALHHDDATKEFTAVVEAALTQILPFERDKASPRVSGAFIYDSMPYNIRTAELRRLVLWCPANVDFTDLDLVPATSEASCPVIPDMPDIKLGPFKFATLPILPSRSQYLTFIDKYSEAQAGSMRKLKFLAPQRTPLSQNVAIGDFAEATFFNNEILTAAPTDAFSFCAGEAGASFVVFRTPFSPDPIPLSALGQVHSLLPQSSYPLGIAWDFPFLLRLEYETMIAGAATVFSFTVPFGTGVSGANKYGTHIDQWELGTFSLAKTLKQCTRFCDHPTFDPLDPAHLISGVYEPTKPFNTTYATQCYDPGYAKRADRGYPNDP